MKALAPFAALLLIAAAPTPSEIEAAAPPGAWTPIPAEDLVTFETSRGRFVMQLAPDFAPAHVAAVRAFVRRGAFAGGAIVRVQDNYVVQWAVHEGAVHEGAVPEGAAPAGAALPAEYERPLAGLAMVPLPGPDAYGDAAGFAASWPVAIDAKAGTLWLQHCYGMVGVGRGNAPDTGDGSELYAVIGHAPRHLDRNMAVVGRLIAGIEQLSSLPRGTEALGFYKTPAERLTITGARLASDMPASERPKFAVMDSRSASFAAYVTARANRSDSFFVRPAGRVDACNVRVPVKVLP